MKNIARGCIIKYASSAALLIGLYSIYNANIVCSFKFEARQNGLQYVRLR